MKNTLNGIFDSARLHKKTLSVILDILLVILSLFLAYLIRLGSLDEIMADYMAQIIFIGAIIVPLKILIFWYLKLYHISFRYISLEDVISIIKAAALTSPMVAFIALVFRDMDALSAGFPRSVIFIDFFLTFFFITGVRAFFRLYYSDSSSKRGEEILIVGCGAAGEQLAREIIRSPQHSYFPVGFVDDDTKKKNTLIHGIRVLGGREDIPKLVRDFNVKGIIIAIPSATSREIRGIMEHVREAGVKDVKVLPGFSDLINGSVTLKDIRDISIEDLLGREPVRIEMERVVSYLEGKNILVTGAGGSIGSELCRQVSRFDPASLVLLDMGETELFDIDRELREAYPQLDFSTIIGDIRDEKRVRRIFKENQIDTVFHAAAYKHVPLMESNPGEAVLNNIHGTKILSEVSVDSGVERFVFVSTDKAVNPTSVMGATKRVAENLIRGISENRTVFVAVRFGNVLGSRGSVVPIFQEQIRKGGPVTITDFDMKRYFMTVSEAVQLILQAGAMGSGGEVFVLDMGEPVSIYQVAEELIRLSGLEPDKDMPIVITGKRPGEKLFEELLTAEEGTTATFHEKIYSARISQEVDADYLKKTEKLISLAREGAEREKTLSHLTELVPTYNPISGKR